MSLSQLEDVFVRNDTPFQRLKDAIIIQARGETTSFSVAFSEDDEAEDLLASADMGMRNVPPHWGREICARISCWFADDVRATFDPDACALHVWTLVRPREVFKGTRNLERVCDSIWYLAALLESEGGWDENTVRIAAPSLNSRPA